MRKAVIHPTNELMWQNDWHGIVALAGQCIALHIIQRLHDRIQLETYVVETHCLHVPRDIASVGAG